MQQVQVPAGRIYGARASDYMPELPGATPGLPDPATSVDQRSAFPLVRNQSGDKCVGESLSSAHWLARKKGIGAIFTMPVDAPYEALNASNPVYNTSPAVSLGLHCQLIVGYGTFGGQVCFIVRNSWGAGFAAGGYAYIPESRFLDIATNIVAVLDGPDLGEGVWSSELGIWTIARAMERTRKTDPIPNVGCMPGDAIAGMIARGVYPRDARDDNPANDTGSITGEEAVAAIGHLFTPDNFLPIANADTTTLKQVLTMGAQRMAA